MTPDLHELAAAYVLGALDADETRAFEARLAESVELRAEVAELREVTGLLALGAPGVPRDDDALKQKLMARVRTGSLSARRPWVLQLGWAAAAAAAVIVGVQTVRLNDAREGLELAAARADSVAAQLARRDATLDHILEPGTELVRLTATGDAEPGIQLFWNPAERAVVLHAYNLPPAPAGRAYQVWFIEDGAPMPGLTFNSEPDGHALVTLAVPEQAAAFRVAAVTEEPAGGSPAPTSPIIVAGSRGE